MANKVPFDVFGKSLRFAFEFLFATLSEDALTLCIGGLYVFLGVKFADSNQLDTLW